ncbi:hypothetical protein DL240_11725 [Lujinxingia litoralis]|uniref:DUF1795 domain-containing protein n=1 Tax=Lujinxingia litoralis TaxID=2211119 RepID=A0A328C4K9_9DELT|nr:hypothetical protein DL240_11725 [Lujinxingia litoralis]
MLALGALPNEAVGQDPGARGRPTAKGQHHQRARAEAVDVEAIGARVRRPSGWVIVPSGPGAVATFRAAADRQAQIEVRLSDQILVGRADRYALSFQNQIQEEGFRVEVAERDYAYGPRVGDRVTYGLEYDGESFRLMTWAHHEGDRMWVFSLFCSEDRLEAYQEVFDEVISEMVWQGAPDADADAPTADPPE